MQRTYHFATQDATHAPDDIVATLIAAGRKQRFSSGEQVIHRGDPARGFWLIASGNVLACRFGADGGRTLFAVLGQGDLIGELACLTGLPQQVNALVEGDSELIWIDVTVLDRLLKSEPDFTRWLLGALANKLRVALDWVEGSQSLSAEARIARILAEIAANEGSEIRMTHQDLADLVGTSRVTVGQVLSRLSREGLLKSGYGRLTVSDPAALASRAASTA